MSLNDRWEEYPEKKSHPLLKVLLVLVLGIGIGAAAIIVIGRYREACGAGRVVPENVGRFIYEKPAPEPEPEPEPEEEPEEDPVPETVTFAFAGDILFDERYATGVTMRARGGFAQCLDDEVLEIMRGVDVMVINNEFPFTDGGAPQAEKLYTFRAATATAQWLSEAGVDLAALANNHVYDYGKEGFDDTLDTLERIGMPYIGAGRNIDEASAPAVYEFGDFSVAILNATQIERYAVPNTKGATETEGGVFRCLEPELLYEKVRGLKEDGHYVIVFVHWGTEKETQPDWLQLEQQEGLYEAGADLVIGAHPHRLQGFTYVGDMPVAYSLGNFLFTSFTLDSGILKVTISPWERKLDELQFYPLLQKESRVQWPSAEERERILEDLRRLSPGVKIDSEGIITKREEGDEEFLPAPKPPEPAETEEPAETAEPAETEEPAEAAEPAETAEPPESPDETDGEPS